MEARIARRLTTVFASVMLIAAISLTASLKQASALELAPQAANLTTQEVPGNTTMYYAQELESGQGVVEAFESKDDSNTDLYDYWYKFKTSNRWSVYGVKLESIDGREIAIYCFDSDGVGCYWGFEGYRSNVTSTAKAGYNSAAARNSWYYFRVDNDGAYSGHALRYDQFKITVTEYPIVKTVAGVHAVKRTKNSLNLMWSGQPNAVQYQVKYRIKGGRWTTVATNDAEFTLSHLKKNKKYQVKVRAYCKDGYDLVNGKRRNWTAWSTIKTFKTKK